MITCLKTGFFLGRHVVYLYALNPVIKKGNKQVLCYADSLTLDSLAMGLSVNALNSVVAE